MTSRTLLLFLLCATTPNQAAADCVSDDDCLGEMEVCIDGACAVPGDSCWGRCGGQAPDGCYCDQTCDLYGDCCPDFCVGCPEMELCCLAECAGKECGDDGCGGSCGSCGEGQQCGEDGQCAPCVPACDGKACGSDGCGGLCGSCEEGLTCTVDGSGCVNCGPCAPWESCQDGSCAAPPALSPCPMGGNMISATCYAVTQKGCCAGSDLFYCESADTNGCPDGVQDCLCHVDCDPDGAGDFTCGWYLQLFMCATPPAEPDPEGTLECFFYECTPHCEGKVCGPDGCGGDCGDCSSDDACSAAGLCVAAGCENRCGDEAPAGCWCDQHCEDYDDCCADRCEVCPAVCGDDPCAGACDFAECGEVGDCGCGSCEGNEICEANQCAIPAVDDAISGDMVGTDVKIDDMSGDAAAGDTGGGGTGNRGTCASGDSVPTAGLIVLFGVLGLAVIRRGALV